MPEPIVRIHLPLEFSGGRLLDSNGDEVRHPLAFPKILPLNSSTGNFNRIYPGVWSRIRSMPATPGAFRAHAAGAPIRSRCSPMIRPESICPETGRTAPTPTLRPDG